MTGGEAGQGWGPDLREREGEGDASLLIARLLASAGAALVLGGFFLDWFSGSAEFAARDFSGADLARLIRNFEIVASSSTEAGQLRAWAVVLYLAPALAANGAALAWLPVRRPAAAIAALTGAVYIAGVLAVIFVLSVASWTELARVLGGTMPGFWASGVGVALLAQSGVMLWRGGSREEPDEGLAVNAGAQG